MYKILVTNLLIYIKIKKEISLLLVAVQFFDKFSLTQAYFMILSATLYHCVQFHFFFAIHMLLCVPTNNVQYAKMIDAQEQHTPTANIDGNLV